MTVSSTTKWFRWLRFSSQLLRTPSLGLCWPCSSHRYLHMVLPTGSSTRFWTNCCLQLWHLMISLELGRALMVWLRGQFSAAIKFYVAYLLFAFMFNGVVLSENKVPSYLRWMFWFSINFWAIGGSVMHHFDDDTYSADACTDLVSCLLSDGTVLVRILGYAPTVNSYRALGILTGLFACLVLLEYADLRYHCASTSFWGNRVTIFEILVAEKSHWMARHRIPLIPNARRRRQVTPPAEKSQNGRQQRRME